MEGRKIFLAPLIILVPALFIALGGTAVRLLWNWLLPPLFGLGQITFWQAVGLLALCRILFGGFGHHCRHDGLRSRWAERTRHMTPEERERFRRGVFGRWGCRPPSTGTEGQ